MCVCVCVWERERERERERGGEGEGDSTVNKSHRTNPLSGKYSTKISSPFSWACHISLWKAPCLSRRGYSLNCHDSLRLERVIWAWNYSYQKREGTRSPGKELKYVWPPVYLKGPVLILHVNLARPWHPDIWQEMLGCFSENSFYMRLTRKISRLWVKQITLHNMGEPHPMRSDLNKTKCWPFPATAFSHTVHFNTSASF